MTRISTALDGAARLRVNASFGRLDTGAGTFPAGVDRKAGVLRGYVVAQVGPFKSDGRGEFDRESLDGIVTLGNAVSGGLRSFFQHESLCSDSLGKFLGRARRLRLSTTLAANNLRVECVRADLHFDPTAMDTPPHGGKPLALYVMDLAESDPGALSSSLVLRADKLFRRKPDGTLQRDANGEELPPLWRPKKVLGSDIVSTGDAVDDLLTPDGELDLPDAAVWQGNAILERFLAGDRASGFSRRQVRERLTAWVDRLLDQHFGPATPATDAQMRWIRLRQHEYRTMELEGQMNGRG